MIKVKLIYNPSSGNGNFKNHLDYIIDRFQQREMQIEPYRISKKESMDRMLIHLKDREKEYNRILIAGGDGTLHQVFNGLLKYDIDLPVGIIPAGTANDYARYLNLPNTMEALIDILLEDHYILSDVGLMNGKYFINVASVGSLIDISQKTKPELKNNLGILAYYIHGISELVNLKSFFIKITSKQMSYEGEIYFMILMNGKSAGGFHKIAPKASICDGLLEVVVFKKCPVYEFASLLLSVLQGEHIHNEHVMYFKTDEISITCDEKVGTDLDGEAGASFPLKVQVIPNKLKILTPISEKEMDEKLT